MTLEVGSGNAEVGKKAEFGSGKSDPASFCWSQNYAAAIDAEVGMLRLRIADCGIRIAD